MVKPDAFDKRFEILIRLLDEDFIPTYFHSGKLSKRDARMFYGELRDKSYFDGMVEYLTSGKVLLMILFGENAISRLRELVGATEPANAAEGTLRRLYGTPNVQPMRNAVHASDSEKSFLRDVSILLPYVDLSEYQ